jgi:hypothetical protein
MVAPLVPFLATYLFALVGMYQSELTKARVFFSMEWEFLSNWAAIGPIIYSQMIHEWIRSSSGVIIAEENLRTGRRTCSSATLATTNPILLTWARTRASAVKSGRSIASDDTARPQAEKHYSWLLVVNLLIPFRHSHCWRLSIRGDEVGIPWTHHLNLCHHSNTLVREMLISVSP